MRTPEAKRKTWIRYAVLIGVVYAVVGVAFARFDDYTDQHKLFMSRLAAWIVSALVFAFHIGYEHFRLKSKPLVTALHTTSAVAFGAFLLAVRAAIHALTAESHVPFWQYLLAFVLWPIFTAIPAFIVSFVIAAVLARFSPRST
jgi:hypothetical protein